MAVHRVLSPIRDCTNWCATAIGQDVWQLYVLSILFMCLSIIIAAIITIEAVKTNDLSSMAPVNFKNILLYTSFVFTTLRCIIFLVPIKYNVLSLVMVNVNLPMFLQFVTFSLLVVFLIKCQLIIHKAKKVWTKFLYIGFVVFTATTLGIMMVGSYFLADGIASKLIYNSSSSVLSPTKGHVDNIFESGSIDSSLSIWTGCAFTTLVLVVGGLGFNTYRMTRKIALSERKRHQVNRFMKLVVLYFSTFLIRSVWNILNVFDANPMQNWIQDREDDHAATGSSLSGVYNANLTFYILFEAMPTMLLVLSFRVGVLDVGGKKTAQSQEQRQLDFRQRQRSTANYGTVLAQSQLKGI